MRSNAEWSFKVLKKLLGASFFAIATAGAVPVLAQTDPAFPVPPYEQAAGDHINFETGELLAQRTFEFQGGFLNGSYDAGNFGTGRQFYGGEFRWRGRSNLEYGLALHVYDDPPRDLISGAQDQNVMAARRLDARRDNITTLSFGPSLKYQYFSNDRFALAAQASVEIMRFGAVFLGSQNGSDEDHFIGSAQLPATLRIRDDLRFHFTPGVAVFPDNLNGNPFFGTFYYVGSGMTWAPNARTQLFGVAQMSLGPGGNAFQSDGSVGNAPIWTVGGRYAVTPRSNIDVFATNGVGFSPSTAALADLPEGNGPLFGLRFSFAPSFGRPVQESYRVDQLAPVTARERQLQWDGGAVPGAATQSPGKMLISSTFGTDGNQSGSILLSLDQDIQYEGIVEVFADDGSVDATRNPGTDARYMFGGRLRFLDQNNGNLFSLSGRILAGRNITPPTVGVVYADIPITYEVSPDLAVNVTPRFAAFEDVLKYGVGVGVNYRVTDQIQLLADVTPSISDEPLIWNVGARYDVPDWPIGLEVFATNAIGRFGLGTLVAQDSPRLGLGVSWRY